MKALCLLFLPLLLLSNAHAQTQTIEGFWQDIAGRTLYKRDVAPTATYGTWQPRDIGLPYFDTKRIRRTAAGYELTDLRYGDDYQIRVIQARDDGIEFVRAPAWSACRMHHRCQQKGDEMLCALEQLCSEAGKDVLDWRGEERYARRAHCERTSVEQALGIPTRCR